MVGLPVQSVPHPDTFVFSVLTVVFLVLTVTVLRVPETVAPAAGAPASLRPGVRIPRGARPRFVAAVPALVAGRSVTGLFLAPAPSVATGILHVTWGAAGGLDIAALFRPAAWEVCGPSGTARSATLLAAVFLALGAAGPAVAVAVASPIAFACGSVMAGLGAGLTFNGNLRGIAEVTTADSRSGVFSAVRVVSYAAPSLPSLPAGLLSPSLGAESHELSLHRVRRSPVADRPRPCRLLPVRWARRTCPTPPPRPHRPGAAAHACRTTARDHDTI
ncbi:hypothetical protein [Streptomyces sp. NPDC046978]|uniref:hypothetical protein n=1 Tax=Streptomyces sp. NPDC046978 TaxID=3154704 RepID=UPI0033D91461